MKNGACAGVLNISTTGHGSIAVHLRVDMAPDVVAQVAEVASGGFGDNCNMYRYLTAPPLDTCLRLRLMLGACTQTLLPMSMIAGVCMTLPCLQRKVARGFPLLAHGPSVRLIGQPADFTRNACRAEAVWTVPYGSPYALVQGTLRNTGRQRNGKMLLTDMPREAAPIVQRGDVCLIGGGPDFFIALAAHPEWGTGHTVWGHVPESNMRVVDAISMLPVIHKKWGATDVTPLVQPVPFTLSFVALQAD